MVLGKVRLEVPSFKAPLNTFLCGMKPILRIFFLFLSPLLIAGQRNCINVTSKAIGDYAIFSILNVKNGIIKHKFCFLGLIA